MKVRILGILILSVLFLVSCENPMESTSEQSLYKGEIVQTEKAPFLVNENSLAKTTTAHVVISDLVNEGTVYGLQTNAAVYAATGGEVLPTNTWIANQNSAPIEVGLSPKLVITFNELSTVTLIGADGYVYVNAEGKKVSFTGDGTITTTEIYTKGNNGLGKPSSTAVPPVLITEKPFAIGGDGGDIS